MSNCSIGTAVMQLREERGMTRYRLAKESKLSYSYLTALEECKHNPSFEVLGKLANGLGVTLSDLISSSQVDVL